MKLKNSIEPLKFYISVVVDANREQIREFLAINNLKKLQYKLWYSLDIVVRNNIISASIPAQTWVGGYADYNDSHLDTLLNRVITKEFLL